jgi:hypothetical protein
MSELDWLASQTPAVIELAKELYRQIRPYCTEKSCKKMIAGKFEYQWKHHARSKKPRSYPAQYYLHMMFQWINEQKHIFEMEQQRQKRLIKEFTVVPPLIHAAFTTTTCAIIAEYLYDPFYYLSGIWAKAFSVFAHVFCHHFGPDELAEEVKQFIEAAFERFMGFVQGYQILSPRRLAPLEDRIAKLNIKMPVRPHALEPGGGVATFIESGAVPGRRSSQHIKTGKDAKLEFAGPRLTSLSEDGGMGGAPGQGGGEDSDREESEVGVQKDVKAEGSKEEGGSHREGEKSPKVDGERDGEQGENEPEQGDQEPGENGV